jgi:hypothetical protein
VASTGAPSVRPSDLPPSQRTAGRLRPHLRAVAGPGTRADGASWYQYAAIARREIERNDAAHNGTMQRIFGIDWTDPALYALVLTARISVADRVGKVAEPPAFTIRGARGSWSEH